MYNNKKQEKSVAAWKYFLRRSQEMLAETQDQQLRKELRCAIRAFRSLIRERALLPQGKRRAIA
jgi:hypothetical protein